ncbi:MAG TPA: ATP-binding protein [Solirubrobacteraceae bacterium]|jgi:signal transduction histidine kinase|nr:ATP-binding protein [Solirubrobacteraceae bacterium]
MTEFVAGPALEGARSAVTAKPARTPRRAIRQRAGWHPHVILAFAAFMIALLLGVFAEFLVTSQARSRNDSQERFLDQAKIAAGLTQAIFTTSDAPEEAAAAKQFGAAVIAPATLDGYVRTSGLAFAYVTNSAGHVIAASHGAPQLAPAPSVVVRRALEGSARFSDLFESAQHSYLVAQALPFSAASGRRVLVLAYPASALSGFLSHYLVGAVPGHTAHALIIDGSGRIVASSVAGTGVGKLPTAQFLHILRSGHANEAVRGEYSVPTGKYEGTRYVVAASIGGSAWRVGITEPTSTLYPADVGSDWWISWTVFAAFAFAALCCWLLLRRSLRGAQLRVAQAQEIDAANAELKATNAELNAFSYSVSHDLRAPLRAIDGFSRIVLEEDQAALTDTQRRYLGLVRQNTATMGTLIDDLLGFSRLASKPLQRTQVDTASLVSEVEEDVIASAASSGAKVRFANGDLPAVDADLALLRQVFTNLIGNAVKYSAHNAQPEVTVTSELRDGERVFLVRDNGVGFDMRYADKLFQVFQRLHRVEDYEGTGVGLAIVQRIITRHGGRIWADSRVDEGATFYFTLS